MDGQEIMKCLLIGLVVYILYRVLTGKNIISGGENNNENVVIKSNSANNQEKQNENEIVNEIINEVLEEQEQEQNQNNVQSFEEEDLFNINNNTNNSNKSNSNNNLNCNNNKKLLPEDLLPKDQDNIWASGQDNQTNYLESGYHIGINTVGQSLKNANRQLRSEPPNPKDAVSPWNMSTIESDTFRKQLELGESNNQDCGDNA